jgi:hypothetical protein
MAAKSHAYEIAADDEEDLELQDTRWSSPSQQQVPDFEVPPAQMG